MGIEELKTMKTQLTSCVQGQLGNLQQVDTKELGEAIDMIKDLSEAIYYCTITESMEKTQQPKEVNNINYFTSGRMYPDYDYNRGDMERSGRYLYYPTGGGSGSGGNSGGSSGGGGNSGGGGRGGNSSGGSSGGGQGGRSGGGTSYFTEMPYEMMRDPREGRAAMRRRMYMEGKEMHKDTNSQLRELQAYLEELSHDVTEMIKDSSPEEKATLRQKMTTLADKIS